MSFLRVFPLKSLKSLRSVTRVTSLGSNLHANDVRHHFQVILTSCTSSDVGHDIRITWITITDQTKKLIARESYYNLNDLSVYLFSISSMASTTNRPKVCMFDAHLLPGWASNLTETYYSEIRLRVKEGPHDQGPSFLKMLFEDNFSEISCHTWWNEGGYPAK